MFILASTVSAGQSHWMFWAAVVATSALFLFVCPLIYLLSSASRESLSSGPLFVRRGAYILKWIAFLAPALMFIGSAVSTYVWLIEVGMSGEYKVAAKVNHIGEFIISAIMGFGISLLCLIGIAIHFFRTRNS